MNENERVWVVDRVEAGFAVLVADNDQETLNVPLGVLPQGSREGSVLLVPERMDGPSWASSRLDEELREERLRSAETALIELRKRDPGGDIVL